MYGFNVTDTTFPFDNRPVTPIRDRTFVDWWFHGHLDYPPHPTDFFELPAGRKATAEIACDKGATSYHASAPADIRDRNNPDNVCPGRGIEAFHTTGKDDVTGCALAIAYESDARKVKPEDFAVFSVNQTCVWTRFTDFQMFEGAFSPPVYNDMYNFLDGAQNDIFVDSYDSLPDPSPVALVPILANTTMSSGYDTTAQGLVVKSIGYVDGY
ncbi:hypothetical protein C0989_006090 [Termitomyces sp. Mn162]|nr:hypothetical protein C0989_006090 [Termitomyces sp. Mn162]